MESNEFAKIVNSTKRVVLSAVQKNLAERFSYAIDDVVQETYIRAFRALEKGKFRGESEISTWLYTIARNEALRVNARQEKEEKKLEKLKKDSLENSGGFTSFFSIDSMMELMKRLPEHYSSVLQKQLSGKTEKEISGELGISPGTVKSRASRGRSLIKKLLSKGVD
ncbi:MAG: RNA polymerase sigma factor [Leptospiraceae bacterium]|nr:RNA polymerase sigma factor [Leptospiraceae bacterium]MCP5510400.1 RNA polymerase sigma factor [Leptospiraceae bacterium]